jgi:dienelactone hydrolase
MKRHPDTRPLLFAAAATAAAFVVIASVTSFSRADQPASQPAIDAAARELRIRARTVSELFLDHLYQHRFDQAASLFAGRLKTELTSGRLPRLLFDIEGPSGSLSRPAFEAFDSAENVGARLDYRVRGERGDVDISLVVSPESEIVGIRIVPRPRPVDVDWPPYANVTAITEMPVTIGADPCKLEGTLTLPKGEGPFPAAVLLHGFGPQDRDQRVGTRRPFRDIAWGLASRGIAVLRFDKRTKTHGRTMSSVGLTLDFEIFEDARFALETLRDQPQVDDRRVLLIGHTFGATLTPSIAAEDGRVAGVVMLAPSALPILDLLIQQGELGIVNTPETQPAVEELDRVRAAVAQIRNRAVPSGREVLGAPAGYWYELARLDGANAVAATAALGRPVLLLAAGRDVARMGDDFGIWTERLGTTPGVTLERYPELTHEFMPDEVDPGPDERSRPMHVDERVIERIAGWIRTVPPIGE